jgi:hypothetical protein
MHKKVFFPSLALISCFIAFSCAPSATHNPTHYFITGHVYDGMNGAPVFNATFRYGSDSGTTDEDGAFSVDLGTTEGTRNEAMGFTAPGYGFKYVDPVRLDTADDNDLLIRLTPLTDALYSVRDIECTIFDDTATEITTAAQVILAILPMNGIYGAVSVDEYDDDRDCYFFSTRVHSDNCLVLAMVQMPDPADSFVVHKMNIDLNASEPVELRFDQPAAGYSAVTLTVDSDNCTASGQYITPYGLLPIVCKFDDGAQTHLDAEVTFDDGTPKTVSVYNPGGWRTIWLQQMKDYVTYAPDVKTIMSTTAVTDPSAAVTIPALDAGRGPTAAPDTDTWDYDAATGEISIDAVADTQLYQFIVLDGLAGPIINFGTIVSFESSIVLPAWVNSIINEDSPRTMGLALMDTDLSGYSLEMMNRDTYPESTLFGSIAPAGPVPYNKTFDF